MAAIKSLPLNNWLGHFSIAEYEPTGYVMTYNMGYNDIRGDALDETKVAIAISIIKNKLDVDFEKYTSNEIWEKLESDHFETVKTQIRDILKSYKEKRTQHRDKLKTIIFEITTKLCATETKEVILPNRSDSACVEEIFQMFDQRNVRDLIRYVINKTIIRQQATVGLDLLFYQDREMLKEPIHKFIKLENTSNLPTEDNGSGMMCTGQLEVQRIIRAISCYRFKQKFLEITYS